MTGLLAVVLASSLALGNSEFDRSAAEGAARIAVKSIKERILKSTAWSKDLKEAMLADPAKAAKRADAEKLCREIFLKASAEELKREVNTVFARLATDLRIEDAFPTDLVVSASVLTEKDKSAILNGSFKNAFSNARKEACEEQAAGIALQIRPSMIEADNDDDKALQLSLAKRIAQSQARPVFEENFKYISEQMVKPIIADVRKEKKRQAEYVRRVRSDSLSPSALSADIASKLADNVSERAAQAQNKAMAWDIFPSVTNVTLRNNVERRIDRHYEASIAETPLGVTEQSLEKDILGNIKAHRCAVESERIIKTASTAKLLADALTAAVKAAPEKERAELANYLKGRMGVVSVVKAVDTRIASDLVPLWRKTRNQIVEKQFGEVWPELNSRIWYPDAETADDISSRSDYADAVKAWRHIPSLVPLAEGRVALEETEGKADAAVAAAFELARAAIAAQSSIVEQEMPGVLAESIKRKDSFWRSTPDLNEIVSMLTDATQKRWEESKNATLWPVAGSAPENAQEQHSQLFPSVKKKIESIARMILKEMEKDPEEREKPPEPQPPEPVESEEEPKEEVCTITFSVSGASVTVKAEKGSRVVAERTEKATAFGFEKAIKEVGAIVGREVLFLK
ncbi:MAG: hypothetical protein J6R63_05135 [Kiritimatiellae bacterium]|nr:hypothetical protein [Kiritimatiellia bacterium]